MCSPSTVYIVILFHHRICFSVWGLLKDGFDFLSLFRFCGMFEIKTVLMLLF
jgi:hypothetical protein